MEFNSGEVIIYFLFIFDYKAMFVCLFSLTSNLLKVKGGMPPRADFTSYKILSFSIKNVKMRAGIVVVIN